MKRPQLQRMVAFSPKGKLAVGKASCLAGSGRITMDMEFGVTLISALKVGVVAPDLYFREAIGQRRAASHQALHSLRFLKAHQPSLGQWVDRHNHGTVLFHPLQCGRHARMVGAWGLPTRSGRVALCRVLGQKFPLRC